MGVKKLGRKNAEFGELILIITNHLDLVRAEGISKLSSCKNKNQLKFDQISNYHETATPERLEGTSGIKPQAAALGQCTVDINLLQIYSKLAIVDLVSINRLCNSLLQP
jgi:hypothetical protein